MSDENKTTDVAEEAAEVEDEKQDEAPESTEDIRAEIEETRAALAETIEAIQEKIDPQHVKEEVKESVLRHKPLLLGVVALVVVAVALLYARANRRTW